LSTTIDPGEDRLHLPASPDPSFRDVVTFAFGDPAAKIYGQARLSHGAATAGLAIVYAGARAVATATGAGAAGGETWDAVAAGGVGVQVDRPLEAWNVAFEGRDGGFDLHFEACSQPAALDPASAAAEAAGMQGYEQLCRVSGSVTHSGRSHGVRCLGQRGQLWGSPDPRRIELVRALSAWFGEDRALTLAAVRPAKAKGHGDELVSGFVFEEGRPLEIDDPRLSTTYDGERRQRRAGLELWMDEQSDYARRAAGEVLCATTLDLGGSQLRSAFFGWRMEGRTGVGCYDVLHVAPAGGGRRRAR
jgi:hypothetical protein